MSPAEVTRPDDGEDRDDRLAEQVTQSFARIARTMPVEGGGVALAAVREARTIRRRRSVGTVAAAAALVAVAVPVSLRLAASQAPPVRPAGSNTAPARPSLPSAEHTATLPTNGSPTGRVVRPYAVDGTYHGASGSARLAATDGLSAVLNLDGGAKVLLLRPSSGKGEVVLQAPDGAIALTLPGVDGQAVADATGRRWALLDARTGVLTVRDAQGTVRGSTESAGPSPIRSVVGFSGDRVLMTTSTGTSLWDPATRHLDQVSGDAALDASDAAGRAVYATTDTTLERAGSICWQVRSTTDQRPVAAPTCGPAGTVTMSADGRYVVVRQASGAAVWVYRATGGRPVLRVAVPAGVTVEDTSLRIGLDELVLAASDRVGHRLAGCTTKGVCEVLTTTSPTPYLLVRD